MQIVALRQRSIHQCSRFFFNIFNLRSSSSLSDHSLIGDPESVVLVEGHACSRTVVLNRPSFLNALNTSMANRLRKLYNNWEDTPDIGFVVTGKGSGKAFCAGGDIVAVHDMIKKGNIEECKELVGTVYKFVYLLGTYSKPHVAILDGITMGGGGGVSIPGTFRVATDKTAFAIPETLIGFHPDAGASFYLSRLPGCLGEYLALTGDRLNGVEMIACGLATHYSPSANIPAIEECLKNLKTNDLSVIETSLRKYSELDYLDNNSVIRRSNTIVKCFCYDTIEEIIDAMGVRARMVGKDFAPKWDPPSLEHVSQDMVNQYFSPLSALEPELDLPTKQREAFT